MPAISRFFGIVVTMYYNDHLPPHFHARYAEHAAEIAIESLEVIEGDLPRRAMALTLEWAASHRDELRENWNKARDGLPLDRVEPLD
jgi:hypothetical protein